MYRKETSSERLSCRKKDSLRFILSIWMFFLINTSTKDRKRREDCWVISNHFPLHLMFDLLSFPLQASLTLSLTRVFLWWRRCWRRSWLHYRRLHAVRRRYQRRCLTNRTKVRVLIHYIERVVGRLTGSQVTLLSGPLPPSTISPSFTSPYIGHNSTRACFRKLGSCYSWTMFRYEVSSLYIIFFSLDV